MYFVNQSVASSVSVFCFVVAFATFSRVYANVEVDALIAMKRKLIDPNNVHLENWNSTTLDDPCAWDRVTCNSNNSVTRLDLGGFNLSGQLVPELGQLQNLEYLELYKNNISGRIPNELGNLTNLVSLDLYLNKLSGPIPNTLGRLQRLRFMRLNNNNLSGQIPVSLTTITTIQVLDLSNNRLTGKIPVNGSFSLFQSTSFAFNDMEPLSLSPTTPSYSSSHVSSCGGPICRNDYYGFFLFLFFFSVCVFCEFCIN